MSKLKVAIVLIAGCCVGGCVNWSSDVDRYRQVLDTVQPSMRPAYDADAPLSLIAALRIANADNETIASSGEDYIQALADKMRQAGTFLPTLTLSPSYTISDSGGTSFSGIGGGAGSGSRRESTSVTASASASGSLSDVSSIRAADRVVEQRRQLLLDTRETVLVQVVQAYYEVLRREKQVEVLRSSVAVREEQVRDQEERLRVGNARPLDLAQSQADLAATQVSLSQARTAAANARSALAVLMGVDAVAGPLTDEFSPPDDGDELDAWRQQALQQRQDLAAAARAVEAARENVEAAIRQYFPSAGINFDYFLYSDPDSSRDWTAGVSLNVPIFSAMRIEAEIRRAWSAYRQAGLAEQRTRRSVLDEVTQAYTSLIASREEVRLLQIQVDAARRAVDLAERAYRLGAESNLNRLIQRDNLLTAELSLIDRQFDEKANYLALLRSVGRLSEVLSPQQ